MSGPSADLWQYGWWIVGLVLLVLEIAIPGVYLLFLGIAALIVGTNTLILGSTGWFGWEQQIVAFVVITVVAVLVGRRWYGPATRDTALPALNSRADRLVGTQGVLSEAIVGGRGKVAVEDGWWMVEGPELPVGMQVRITSARGSTLIVEPVDG